MRQVRQLLKAACLLLAQSLLERVRHQAEALGISLGPSGTLLNPTQLEELSVWLDTVEEQGLPQARGTLPLHFRLTKTPGWITKLIGLSYKSPQYSTFLKKVKQVYQKEMGNWPVKERDYFSDRVQGGHRIKLVAPGQQDELIEALAKEGIKGEHWAWRSMPRSSNQVRDTVVVRVPF